MADINNSLALGIKSDPIDVMKPLLGASQINALRANTAKTQQDIDYNQLLQDQGQNGMRPHEENTLAEAHTKQLGIQGQIGNMMESARTKEDRLQAIKASEDAGKPVDPKVKQHLLDIPLPQFQQYGRNMKVGGQTSTANIEQSPGGIAQRSYMGAAGSTAGPVGGDIPPVPAVPAMQSRPENAPIRTNPDGSIAGNMATEPVPAKANPMLQAAQTKAKSEQLSKNVEIGSEQYKGYQKAQEASGVTKIVLKSVMDDSDRVFTGNGAETALNARKWVQSLQQMPGVGGIIQKYTPNMDDPVAAAENVRKNVGLIAREAMGTLGGSAAAELDNITNSLPSTKMSGQGLKLAASQMIAIEDYKQARLIAADNWRAKHDGSMDGFATDMSKNMGPGVFVMARLPKDEQAALAQRLQKTPEGQRTLASIHRQSLWIEKQKNIEGVID